MRHRTADTPKGHRNYVIIACDVLLFLAMLKWLPVEPEVARGLAVLTFIGILWLTEALHVTVTSLLVPVLAMFMGILPGEKALSGFADPTIFLFFGGFALAGALHEQKIDAWLAGKILRMARGSLGMALILIFLATAFLSMWMSNTATAAMMLPLVIGLLDRVPAEKLKTTAPFAILGVAYSASIGGMGTLVGSPPNAIAAHELGMGFAEWFRIAMPIVLVFGVIVFFLMYLFLRPNLGMHVDMEPAEGENAEARLNARQVRVLILFVLVAGSWMCSSFLSSALGGIPSMDTLIALSAAVLLPLCEREHYTQHELLEALYVASGIGAVIAYRASISGAAGGCQAEIGTASAMAAGALVSLRGGTNEQIGHAVAIALKNLMGLVCDPVAGLVEVPCVKRNVIGAVNAISAADMALAGIESRIPVDEVIDAMGEVGRRMPVEFRETALGGLAATPTGKAVKERMPHGAQ